MALSMLAPKKSRGKSTKFGFFNYFSSILFFLHLKVKKTYFIPAPHYSNIAHTIQHYFWSTKASHNCFFSFLIVGGNHFGWQSQCKKMVFFFFIEIPPFPLIPPWNSEPTFGLYGMIVAVPRLIIICVIYLLCLKLLAQIPRMQTHFCFQEKAMINWNIYIVMTAL